MNESAIVRGFLSEARAQGAHAFRIQDRAMGGIPDMFIKFPDLPAAWIEAKYLERKQPVLSAPLNLTALQSHFIVKHHKVGGVAGWVLFVRNPSTSEVTLFVGVHPTHLTITSAVLRKARLDPWPVREVVSWLSTNCSKSEESPTEEKLIFS
jgi:hypothetical protein